MKRKKLIIGSRASKLALIYANRVKDEISKYFNQEITIKKITTKGDTKIDIRLSEIGGKGLFSKNIEEELLKKNIDIFIIILNIIFFSYYAIQLLIFTDEFAMNNLGFFNHAVAGLSEIVGIIFVTFVLAYIIIMFRGIEKQLPFIFLIFIFQVLVSLNFWRYVFTNSPGETSLNIIATNAIFFSILSILNLFFIFRNFKKI